jgi:hypothetical protein
MKAVPLQVAIAAQGQKINTYGEKINKESNVAVALWRAGPKQFLLLKAANRFIGYEELPLETTISQAISLQEEKLVCLQGGKA